MRPPAGLLVTVSLLTLVACTREAVGPSAPIAPAQVTPGPALEASAARRAVVAFVEAYRASPEQGIGPLANLVVGPDLGAWVRWLDVQHREFGGAIEATADVRDVEFIGAIESPRISGASVGLSASVAFTFDPSDASPFQIVRVLDGPVSLVRTAPGTYAVLDVFRNGVPMSDGIQPFRNQRRSQGGITVLMDSLFMFPPRWQFNVVVHNDTGHDIVLDESASTLFVDRGDGFERVGEGAITPSLRVVPAGQAVDGLMSFPAQRSAEGRVLSLVYQGGRSPIRFEFPLGDLVTAVPPPPPGEADAIEVSPQD